MKVRTPVSTNRLTVVHVATGYIDGGCCMSYLIHLGIVKDFSTRPDSLEGVFLSLFLWSDGGLYIKLSLVVVDGVEDTDQMSEGENTERIATIENDT